MEARESATPGGAYGFRVRGVGPDALVADPPASWPELLVERAEAEETDAVGRAGDRAGVRLTPGGAEILLGASGACRISRDPLRAVFALRHDAPDVELVHPYLGGVAAVAGRWIGIETFHAGGFLAEGGAWALLAERAGGKSTTLATLAAQGIGILADDLLAISGAVALAGPRSVDLRREAADRFDGVIQLGTVGARERWRLPLGPVPPEVPFSGWVFLEWGDSVALRRIGPAELLARLTSSLTVAAAPTDPSSLLRLAALPGFVLSRARGLGSMPAVVDELLGRSP